MVSPTMMNTIMVVSQVSFQLGQVTLLISRRTSWKNCSGDVRRRATGASASASITCFFVTSTISTLQTVAGAGGLAPTTLGFGDRLSTLSGTLLKNKPPPALAP